MKKKPNIKFGERLKTMRKNRKNINQTDLGNLMGVKQSTISRWEAGIDEPEHDHLRALADYFNCSVDYLLGTENLPETPRLTPVVGYVGAGEVNIPFDDYAHGDGMDEVETPPGLRDTAVAVKVSGDSMYPAYEDGDIIFYIRNGIDIDESECIGRQCIIKVLDGPIYIKRLSRGSAPGLYHLESHNAPPMHDKTIEWAARVLYVKKA
ncbi:MAG: helix-turn-helix transcriptional regulator [Kordiimonadaceae bacterium]|nr:helix-turn-helix transcriptional regulator [Kordiimonadaceae bacterium]